LYEAFEEDTLDDGDFAPVFFFLVAIIFAPAPETCDANPTP
jgi:hypothetical protein